MFGNNQQGQQMLNLMQASLIENRQFMKDITDRLMGREEQHRPTEEGLPERGGLFEKYPNPYEDTEIDSFYKKSRHHDAERVVIISPYPEREDEYQSSHRNTSVLLGNTSRVTSNQQPQQMGGSQLGPNNASRIIGRGSNVMPTQSAIQGRHGYTQSQLAPNQSQSQSQRPGPQAMRLFNRESQLDNRSSLSGQSRHIPGHAAISYQGQCSVIIKLQVHWTDDNQGLMPAHLVEETITMNRFKEGEASWQQELIIKLSDVCPIVRHNARMHIVHSCRNEAISSPTFAINGQLDQQIINLPQPYEATWSHMQEGYAYHFNIRNSKAIQTQSRPQLPGRTQFLCQNSTSKWGRISNSMPTPSCVTSPSSTAGAW